MQSPSLAQRFNFSLHSFNLMNFHSWQWKANGKHPSLQYCLNSKIKASHSPHLSPAPGLFWFFSEVITSRNKRLISLDCVFIWNICFDIADPRVNISRASQYSPSVFQGCTGWHCSHSGTYLKFSQVNMCLMCAGECHCNEDSPRYCNSTRYGRNFWMYSSFAVSLA